MGLEFQSKGKRKGKIFYECGYGFFLFFRKIIISQYNPTAGLLFCERGLTEEQQNLLDRMEEYVPAALFPLIDAIDCDGEIAYEQLKPMVEVLKNGPFIKDKKDIEPIKVATALTQRVAPTEMLDNAWMNGWRADVTEFVDKLEKVVKRKMGIVWS